MRLVRQEALPLDLRPVRRGLRVLPRARRGLGDAVARSPGRLALREVLLEVDRRADRDGSARKKESDAMIPSGLFDSGVLSIRWRGGACQMLEAYVARTAEARERGLLGFEQNEFRGLVAMVLVFDPPVDGRDVVVTTSGMRLPIDVVFVDDRLAPVALVEDAPPNSGDYRAESERGKSLIWMAIELSAGVARSLGINCDCRIELSLPGRRR